MALKEPVPGLRRILHDSHTTTRVELHFAAGDELEVSEDVAAQLQAADTHFIPVEDRDAKADRAKAREKAARKSDKESEDLPPAVATAAETVPHARARKSDK